MFGEGIERVRDIAGWLLTTAPAQLRASDFKANVRTCRELSTQQLNTVLDPLVGGGWLEPETSLPNNRRWTLDLKVREVMPDRAEAARERREATRRMWEQIGRPRRGE
jgi:hypothetical protein